MTSKYYYYYLIEGIYSVPKTHDDDVYYFCGIKSCCAAVHSFTVAVKYSFLEVLCQNHLFSPLLWFIHETDSYTFIKLSSAIISGRVGGGVVNRMSSSDALGLSLNPAPPINTASLPRSQVAVRRKVLPRPREC